jgi:arsenite methyltransferase
VKSRKLIYLTILCLSLPLAATVAAQQRSQQPADPELELIEKTIREAWREADQYVKAGGKESDAKYPGRKWAATLWQYRQRHPGAASSAQATAQALHFLLHAEQVGEMIVKADSLAPDDAAWKEVIGVLREAAEEKKDYDYLIAKSKSLLEKSPDGEVKMRAQFALAQGLWKKGEIEAARTAFQKFVAEYPNTPLAREAEGNIHELDALNLGQPAPLFAYRGINGEPVSLADFRGKVTLLNFWASWCGACAGEFPLLKELYAKHKDQGLAIIGVSLDEEAKAFQEAVSKHELAWPQVRDGKDGQIARLFNVHGTPAYYLLNREGKIAAKSIPAAKLKEVVVDLLKSGSTPAELDGRDKEQKPDEVLKLINVKPGQVIVDIGAGSGYFTRRFAAAVGPAGKAIGVEIDSAMVRSMNADAKRLSLTNYEARLVPPDDPMLAASSVDAIFLCDTYHHISDRAAYFAKVRQALKPGGRLVILDSVRTKENADHSIVKEEVVDELRRAGFRLAKEFYLLLPKKYLLEFEAEPGQGSSIKRTSNDETRPRSPADTLSAILNGSMKTIRRAFRPQPPPPDQLDGRG